MNLSLRLVTHFWIRAFLRHLLILRPAVNLNSAVPAVRREPLLTLSLDNPHSVRCGSHLGREEGSVARGETFGLLLCAVGLSSLGGLWVLGSH